MDILYKKNPGQKVFHEDLTHKFVMACGGLGSGKSFALVMKGMQLSAINQDMPGGLLCPTLKEFKRDMAPIFSEMQSLYIPSLKFHKSDNYYIFPWSDSPLYIFTAERSIKGPNLAYALVNEFSSIEWPRIQELINRVRVKNAKCPQVAFAGTPEDEYLWLEEFIKRQTDKGNLGPIIEMMTQDNSENLGSEYIQILRDTLTDKQFQLYALGKIIRLDNDYFYYSYESRRNDWPVVYDESRPIYANLDFNVGRMTCTLAHVIGEGRQKQILFFDEIVLTDFGSDTESMGRAILARYPNLEEIQITCDASGKARKTSGMSDVQTLTDMGFKVRFKSVNPRLRKRQITVNGLLARRNILLNAEKCPILKRDLQKVEQDKATFEKKKTNPELTHASDTLDYLCDFEFENFLEKEQREKFFIRKQGA